MTPESEQILAAIALLDEANTRLHKVTRMDYGVIGTARHPLADAQGRLLQARGALTDTLGAAVAAERLS